MQFFWLLSISLKILRATKDQDLNIISGSHFFSCLHYKILDFVYFSLCYENLDSVYYVYCVALF